MKAQTKNAQSDDPVSFVASLQWQAHRAGKLGMWTIYDRPKDYPDGHIARQFIVNGQNGAQATAHCISGELERLRKVLSYAGLVCLTRSPPMIRRLWRLGYE